MKAFRHEWKYVISYGQMEELKLRMRPYFRLDEHVTNGEYTIRSLYFDDLWDSAYEEKEAGIFFRKKYRIRIYNYGKEQIKLERKIKQGNYIYKESGNLTVDEVEQILLGEYAFLLHHKDPLCREFYVKCVSHMMRPRVIVDYEREPFIMDAGTVRITFDKQVRAAIGGFDLFDAALPTLPAMPKDKLIMEVKYTEFLPQIVRNLIPPGASEFTAASKFVLCADQTKYLHGYDYYIDERNVL